jgi:hypothetical protein
VSRTPYARLLRLLRPFDPLVEAILASRAHGLLSGRLLVLAYRGHRSGRIFRIPLRYAEDADGRLVALAVDPAGKRWWRSFRRPSAAAVVLRGDECPVVGVLVAGSERERALAAYVGRYPRSARLAETGAIVVFEAR